MKKEYKYFIIEIIIGALIGFFFLHPLSMLINGGMEALRYCFKDNMHHLVNSPMAWYFTLIGVVLAAITAFSRIAIQKKNILLEEQKQAIQEKNEELEAQKEEIQAQAENLMVANAEITSQKELLAKQHHNLTSSIRYAKTIQTAMLVPEETIKEILPNSFILFMPRDIVSGDFYWIAEKSDFLFISTVDCTGHGVPGAFMSMVGNQLLNQIILEMDITETDQILVEMNKGIKKFLKQNETVSRDGMDMSICRIDFKRKKIQFSGAANDMYIVQNEELIAIEADRKHIGGVINEKASFTKKMVDINQPTTLYLFTDGYSDQSNNKDFKKLGKRNFRNLLKDIHNLSLEEQKSTLIKEHELRKETQKQTDDILLIGIKL